MSLLAGHGKYVLKYDGLASGKGVWVIETEGDIDAALEGLEQLCEQKLRELRQCN